MKKSLTPAGIALRIWLLTSCMVAIVITITAFSRFGISVFPATPIIIIASVIGSAPAFIILLVAIPFIHATVREWKSKLLTLFFVQFVISAGYGLLAALINIPLIRIYSLHHSNRMLATGIISSGVLFACSLAASFMLFKALSIYFSASQTKGFSYTTLLNLVFTHSPKNKITMETFEPAGYSPQETPQSNRILIKGLITGGLILLMLIPTIFISNLITEREARQKEVVREVSSKWATAQTVSGPYLVVPYADSMLSSEGKTIVLKKQLILLANSLDVTGKILPEERPRSIYKVLLYKSDLKLSGAFKSKWPADINPAALDFANARLCFGITDFKGIEEEIGITFNDQKLNLTPGLPLNNLELTGLSVPVSFNSSALDAGIKFDMHVKLKGSEQLHFMPLSANSRFTLNSPWPSPSFDGNTLPDERSVTDKGFSARWSFNQANLPFGTVLKPESFTALNLAFGVSMVQPADQYNKTMRSVKYAILFIGLTFALFFIIEIMQRRPFHPVQYVLVGLALVIFYTLLLSISEYLLFDYAYLIAAVATILLITLYAKSHFTSWKTAAVFGTVLSCLYGFIFILIRLEDTALLVGSIGLFAVLAIVMYMSRKVNWYGDANQPQINTV